MNTCKDVLLALVDDGLVDSEKIGTSVYYWALPSKALATKRNTCEKVENEFKSETARNLELKQRVENLVTDEDDSERRAELMNNMQELSDMKKKILAELDAYAKNDPELVTKMRAGIVLAKTSCNRWIENIFSLKSWMKNKFRVEEKVIDKQFEIPSDLDYIN